MKKKILSALALILVVIMTLSIPSFAISSDIMSKNNVFIYDAVASRPEDNPPSYDTIHSMPYYCGADMEHYVYTRCCVVLSGTSLRITLDGSVNSDTPGTCKIQVLVYNAKTGMQVASRTTTKSSNFNNSWTITQLRKDNHYYVKVVLVDKTSTSIHPVRVTFNMKLNNA